MHEGGRVNILVIGKFYTKGFVLHAVETQVIMGDSVRFEPGSRSGRIGAHFGHRPDQVRVAFPFEPNYQ